MREDQLNFNPLSEKVSEIYSKVDRIEKLLNDHPSFKDELRDDILTIEGACEFTSLAKQTLYQLVSERRIPFMKRKGSKRLYFSRNELKEWILSGRKKTIYDRRRQK